MIDVFVWSIYLVQIFCLWAFSFYAWCQLYLVRGYWLWLKQTPPPPLIADFPLLTVQLPIYNEPEMIDPLFDCLAKLDYPPWALQVQILDDSDDQTIQAIDQALPRLQAVFPNTQVLRRSQRQGYKAGALAAAMAEAQGEFIAIFDADFRPPAFFLKRALGILKADAQLGLVQGAWLFNNEKQNLLTRLQALMLDAHFSIEQGGRQALNYCLHFNGTAGLWRRSCIEQAGGWSSLSLTEDLDLSFRAQFQGWKIYYAGDYLGVPSELPNHTQALRSQQFRWSKGPAQCLIQHAPKVGLMPWPWPRRLQACLHLGNSNLFLLNLLLLLHQAPFMLWVWPQIEVYPWAKNLWLLGSLSLIPVFLFFSLAFFRRRTFSFHQLLTFLGLFPLFIAALLSLAWLNAGAVLEAYRKKSSPFIRTAKGKLSQNGPTQNLAWGEFCFVSWLFSCFIWSILSINYFLILFYFLPLLGYAMQVNFRHKKAPES